MKLYLAIVGAAYIALAVWCAALPDQTARAIGFELSPGAGQSEYFTVYGGLQLALGAIFLVPLVLPDALSQRTAVGLACLVHGCLVVFRTIAFLRFNDIPPLTMGLACGEWGLFLTAGLLLRKSTPPADKQVGSNERRT